MTAGGWETWTWDETLFQGAAPYYERGRLPYAKGLASAFRDALGLDGAGRLLDVGCGPGTVALRLAHLFDEVVGLDPDGDMLDEAARIAADRGVANARWERRKAEAIAADLGAFRVVTFAASFHWMDRPRVAALVRELLDPGGVVVHVDNRNHADLEYDPPLPVGAIEHVRRSYLGEDRRAGQSVRNTSPSGEPAVFATAGFSGPDEVWIPNARAVERTIDDLVAETFSASGTAPHLFGDRVAAFEADIRAALSAASPSGRFTVPLNDNVLFVYRPCDAP